jgi:hypothetical protein
MPLGQSDYEAIEIAITATGAAGVIDMQARLSAQLRDAEAAAAGAERVLKGQAAAMANTQGATRGATQAVLEFSRGVEDLTTGGPLGLLNNIPGLFQGIGRAIGLTGTQLAALTGGVSLLATAAYAAWLNWDRIKKAFEDGIPQRLVSDLKEVKAELERLEAIEVKTRFDYSDIDIAKRKLAELTEAEKIYQALKSGKTVDQAERAKLVSQAITEQGGGVDAVIKAVAGLTQQPESEATRKNREAVAFIQDPANKYRAGTDPANLRKYQQQLADTQAQDRRDHFDATKATVAGAAGGNERQRQYIEDLLKANPEKFAAAGAWRPDRDTPGPGRRRGRGRRRGEQDPGEGRRLGPQPHQRGPEAEARRQGQGRRRQGRARGRGRQEQGRSRAEEAGGRG